MSHGLGSRLRHDDHPMSGALFYEQNRRKQDTICHWLQFYDGLNASAAVRRAYCSRY